MAKTSTLTDGFATLDGAVWTTGGDGSPVTAVGGLLKCQYSTGAFGNGEATTINTYDLTNSSILVQLADIGTRQTGWQALLYALGPTSNDRMRMILSDDAGGIDAQITNGGVTAFDAGGVAFDENVHKWMRIRETAGTLFFETSTLGTQWTTVYSVASSVVTWPLTAVKIRIEGARSTSQATGGYSSFDNLNLPPATPQGNFFRFFDSYTSNIGGNPGGGPPPSGGGSAYIATIADWDYLHWEPSNSGNPAVPENSSFHAISTPSGPGFEFVCTDANETAWNNQFRAVLAQKNNSTALGQTQDWTWDQYMPTQTINKYVALFIQFHPNGLSSGNWIGIDQGTMTYRLGRQSGPGETYDITLGVTPVIFDRWVPFRIQIKWSLGGDGFIRYWIDGNQVMSFNGATQFAGEGTPWLQMGWYGRGGSGDPSGVTNIIRIANIQRTVS